jgi:hypothetical protein
MPDSPIINPDFTQGNPDLHTIRLRWPWGQVTCFAGIFGIGRDAAFCAVAEQLRAFPCISRKHAVLTSCAEGVWVRDLRSRNGTYIGRQKIPPGRAHLLDSDSYIRCGPDLKVKIILTR